MNSSIQNLKINSLIPLLIGGLFWAGVFYVMSQPDDRGAKSYVEFQEAKHIQIAPISNNIYKAVFEKFPDASVIMVGNAYTIGDDFSLIVRPSSQQIKTICDINSSALEREKFGVYRVAGKLSQPTNLKITPYNQKTSTSNTNNDSFLGKFFYALAPGSVEFLKGAETFKNGMDNFSATVFPYGIVQREAIK